MLIKTIPKTRAERLKDLKGSPMSIVHNLKCTHHLVTSVLSTPQPFLFAPEIGVLGH